MTPETLFTVGELRQAARAGWHAARGEEAEAIACSLAARREAASAPPARIAQVIDAAREAHRTASLVDRVGAGSGHLPAYSKALARLWLAVEALPEAQLEGSPS